MSVLTPNMSLIESTVGVDSGLLWEENLNSSLDIVDGHDHSPGSGVPITPSGLNINTDLTLNLHNLTTVRSVRFSPQSIPITGSSPDVGIVYESGVDLYYNDGNGNQIRLTQSGSIAGTTGSISGLVAPASASYIPLSKTFVWQSDVNKAANLDAGAIILRDLTTSSFGITIAPSATLSADYAITLPPATPERNSVLNVSTAGVAVWQSSYDAIVGTSAQVTDGSATHTTLTAAIAAVSANGKILVLQGAWTENITISKTLYITGSGTNSVFTGNVSYVGATYGSLTGIRWTGTLSMDSASTGNNIVDCYMASNQTATDSGSNFVESIWVG